MKIIYLVLTAFAITSTVSLKLNHQAANPIANGFYKIASTFAKINKDDFHFVIGDDEILMIGCHQNYMKY